MQHPASASCDHPGTPYCARFADGLVCNSAWDAECVWKVLGGMNIAGVNPCSWDLWDKGGCQNPAGGTAAPWASNDLCANGMTSGSTWLVHKQSFLDQTSAEKLF